MSNLTNVVSFQVFKNKTNADEGGKHIFTDWDAFTKNFAKDKVRSCDINGLTGDQVKDLKQKQPLLHLVTFDNDIRKGANVNTAYGLWLDFDNKNGENARIDEVVKNLQNNNIKALIYTSFSHTDDVHKIRVVSPLNNPINLKTAEGEAQYLNNLATLNAATGGKASEDSFKTISQGFYAGMINSKGNYQVYKTEGNTVDEFFTKDELKPVYPQKFKKSDATKVKETVTDADDFTLDAANPTATQQLEIKLAIHWLYDNYPERFEENSEWVNWAYKFSKCIDKELGFQLFKYSARLTTNEKYLEGGEKYASDDELRRVFNSHQSTNPECHWNKICKDVDILKEQSAKGKVETVTLSDDFIIRGDSIPDFIPATEYWIHKIVQKEAIMQTFGASGSGKSFITIDQAFCIAAGIDWEGHNTKQGTVLYICGEGYKGIIKRIKALEIKYNRKCPRSLLLASHGVNMSDKNVINVFKERLTKILDESENCDVIILDTFSRCFGGNENAIEDYNLFISNVSENYSSKGSTVWAIHHTGHGEKTRARGTSGMKDNMDVELFVFKNNEGETCFKWEKLKDGAEPEDVLVFKGINCKLDCITGAVEETDKNVPYFVIDRIEGKTGNLIWGNAKDITSLKAKDEQCLNFIIEAIKESEQVSEDEELLKIVKGHDSFDYDNVRFIYLDDLKSELTEVYTHERNNEIKKNKANNKTKGQGTAPYTKGNLSEKIDKHIKSLVDANKIYVKQTDDHGFKVLDDEDKKVILIG